MVKIRDFARLIHAVEGAAVSSPLVRWPVEFDDDFPHSGEVEMYVHVRALRKMLEHVWAHRETGLEVMGLMIGDIHTWNGQEYTVVKDVVTGKLDATAVNVKFTEDAFAELFDQLDNLKYDYILAGWYHSHPGHTCFLSATDINTQHTMFKKPYQTALVIDPLNVDFKAYTTTDVGFREKAFAVYRAAEGKKIKRKKVVHTHSIAKKKKVLKIVE